RHTLRPERSPALPQRATLCSRIRPSEYYSGPHLHGTDGTLQIIRQLQRYEIPASAWESEILARRIGNYDPELLDELCLSGEVMWARVSPHPAIAQNRRVRPTRIAPVTLFLREDADWLMSEAGPTDSSGLSDAARDGCL